MELRADRQRCHDFVGAGILVRAINVNGLWDNIDIAHLDAESLLTWLRSRGGANDYAEQVVFLLLGHSATSQTLASRALADPSSGDNDASSALETPGQLGGDEGLPSDGSDGKANA
jgi:hypothetical protein